MAKNANGEGSIYPYRSGFAAQVWVITPNGERKRKTVYGKTREEVHGKWVTLHHAAAQRPVPTSTPKLDDYLREWLEDVVRPNLEITTYAQYESVVRVLITPKPIAKRKLDRLTVRDVQQWLNALARECQCCAQGKDAKRPTEHRDPKVRQRCCAIGRCCGKYPARGTLYAARAILRSALAYAETEELVPRNVAEPTKLPKAAKRRKRAQSWTVEQARQFLESAQTDQDRLYAAYVLLLVMGLRRGELLGLPKHCVRYEVQALAVGWQVRRVLGELRHDESVKTEESEDDDLPMPELCAKVLREHLKRQARERATAGAEWQEHGLVFTTKVGTPIDPRNFYREFQRRCAKAGVPLIRVHDARHTCASLLAALDVHPSVARAIMRHSKIATTMEVYTQVSSERSREALRRLGDSLDGSSPDGA